MVWGLFKGGGYIIRLEPDDQCRNNSRKYSMISPSIKTEAKKAHKPGERSPYAVIGELHGRGLIALAYEIETYKCQLYDQIYDICTNKDLIPLYVIKKHLILSYRVHANKLQDLIS